MESEIERNAKSGSPQPTILGDTADSTENEAATPKGLDSRAIAVIGYLPMLFLVPLLLCRDDDFVRFHGWQSMALFFAFMVLWFSIWLLSLILSHVLGEIVIIGFIFEALGWLIRNLVGGVLSLGYLLAMVIGMIQAASANRWRIPFVGRYAERYLDP